MACPSSEFTLTVQQSRPIAMTAELACTSGQLLALVGPSGSGKSSLLRMIAGLSRPQSGRIVCGGEVWLDTSDNIFLPPQRRRIGYVPQHYGLFPHMTALQNICAGLSQLPKDEQLPRAQAWLNRMHLNGLEKHRPAELSGGQQQRVALARALAGNPSILLLDEPFSAVDSTTRERLHGELAELRHQLEIPVILVTHDLDEALMLADSLTLLDQGETLQSGSPAEVTARPRNVAAAQLLGMRNLFDGTIIAHDPEALHTLIAFGGIQLVSPYRPEFTIGQQIQWGIPQSGIRFRAISGTVTAAADNAVNQCRVQVSNALLLGEEVRLSLQVAGVEASLQVNVPLRLARELRLNVGSYSDVRLRPQDIHVFSPST